jgi:hypothetical protein
VRAGNAKLSGVGGWNDVTLRMPECPQRPEKRFVRPVFFGASTVAAPLTWGDSPSAHPETLQTLRDLDLVLVHPRRQTPEPLDTCGVRRILIEGAPQRQKSFDAAQVIWPERPYLVSATRAPKPQHKRQRLSCVCDAGVSAFRTGNPRGACSWPRHHPPVPTRSRKAEQRIRTRLALGTGDESAKWGTTIRQPASHLASLSGLTTKLSSRAGWRDFTPRNAVMPARSAAAPGSAGNPLQSLVPAARDRSSFTATSQQSS